MTPVTHVSFSVLVSEYGSFGAPVTSVLFYVLVSENEVFELTAGLEDVFSCSSVVIFAAELSHPATMSVDMTTNKNKKFLIIVSSLTNNVLWL